MIKIKCEKQLVYLWLDMKNNSIQNLQLQFSPKYAFNFDVDTGKLSVQSLNFVDIFSCYYNKVITNVSAIVGENGCGKTTLIKEMFEILRRGRSDGKYLALYFDASAAEPDCFYWQSNLKNEKNRDKPFKPDDEKYTFKRLEQYMIDNQFFLVRYTDVLNLSDYAKRDSATTDNSIDLSMACRIQKATEEATRHFLSVDRIDPLIQMFHDETTQQIRAIDDINLPVSLNELTLTPCKILEPDVLQRSDANNLVWQSLDDKPKVDSPHDKAVKLCRKLLLALNTDENLPKLYVIVRAIMYTYLRYAIHHFGLMNETPNTGHGVPAAIRRQVIVPVELWLKKLASIKQMNVTKIREFLEASFESVGLPGNGNDFLNNLRRFIELLLNDKKIAYDKKNQNFTIPLSKFEKNEILDLHNAYKNSIGQFGEAFAFEFNISSGERAFLNLFAYLRRAKEIMKKADEIARIDMDNNPINNYHRSVIVLFDELDAFLHPRWQQRAVDTICTQMMQLFGENNVHIIFSTHSPILLSDIPVSNIIYLRKEKGITKIIKKEAQTFADNIYHLYHDSFFLDKSPLSSERFENEQEQSKAIWIHGVLAAKVIKEIEEIIIQGEKILNEFSPENERLKIDELPEKIKNGIKLAEQIGEPFLRTVLRDRLSKIAYNLKMTRSRR